MPEAARRAALDVLAPTAEQRGKMLMQIANENKFDPTQTAQAITPLLLDLSNEGVFAITEELDALLDSKSPGLRSAALALKVRSGDPLAPLAKRDPEALLNAITAMNAEQVPASLTTELLDLAETGVLEPAAALNQAARLTNDYAALFKRLSGYLDAVAEDSFENWGDAHLRGMAALSALHRVDDENWPTGYSAYRIDRPGADLIELGQHIYHEEETGCVRCHGEHGEGGSGYPALAGSPWVLGSPLRAASIVRYGLEGELKHMTNPVTGELFGQPGMRMEPMAHLNESDIAAVLTYVRSSWGNFASPVSIEHVANAKEADAKGDGGMYQHSSEVLKLTPFNRDTIFGSTPLQINVVKWSPPNTGLLYLLALVTACMLIILIGTYAAKHLPPLQPTH